MSEKPIEGDGKAFLVLLLPISFLIIFLVATWRILLAVIVLVIAFKLWQEYQWQQWTVRVNPIFHQLVRENQGRLTPMDLAIRGNFPGTTAKRYLDTKASEFGASIVNSEEAGQSYYFITASILGNILDSSEPVKELPAQPVTKTARSLLAPLPTTQDEEPETESLPQQTHEETKLSLEKQLIFGSLIQSELAKRLNVYSSTVYKRRNDPEFPDWSRNKDPDGIAWSYSEKTKEFFPVEKEV
ncbi:hypothetical protein [Nostoc sp. 'Lobaria pulmonaria (5183) cyanobiont']|uniref:hypothetical protein n=1 Tax=Nostoc sp. 'Lobaria pulmonaria (5183) cyanobiont' TaxID=1618022 RepID=UPI000CF334CF|nr:hypothetical protein [Nostoc sp. 'Lobaria pulmonaria (5183) cyanobiont']AVH73984.1 hypothetical protein NLP_5698 [Nostoc sp. 'Lobaria pulmonaria (5183) cyanobiont']